MKKNVMEDALQKSRDSRIVHATIRPRCQRWLQCCFFVKRNGACAENELSVLTRQCLSVRMNDMENVRRAVP